MEYLKQHEITPDLERLILLIREKRIVLWAGSGFSMYAGYPSARSLCQLICDAAKNQEDKDILNRHIHSLVDISMEFEQLYSRKALIELISSIYDAQPKTVPFAHQLCAKIPQINTIITTNYDHLFEYAYQDKLNVISGEKLKNPEQNSVTLFKIHGDTSNDNSLVVTSKDYATFYDRLDSLLWSKVKVTLAEHSILFVGFSMEDKNIEDVFEKVLMQIDTHGLEFFIAVPHLDEHKLKHFNTICETTHIPITGEKLMEIIECEIRENIVYDAINKKVDIDQAHEICHDNEIELKWGAYPNGKSTSLMIEEYVYNPFATLPIRGLNITSSPETYETLNSFLDDCDCREISLPPDENVKLFDVLNGINIPVLPVHNGNLPDVFKVIKPEKLNEVLLEVDGANPYPDTIIIRSYWGRKRQRVNIEFRSIILSILHENPYSHVSISFRDQHTASDAVADLGMLEEWANGQTLIFKHIGEPNCVSELPNLPDCQTKEQIEHFINRNLEIRKNILRVEKLLDIQFSVPEKITRHEQDLITRLLATFEPQEVGDVSRLKLEMKYDKNVFEMLTYPNEQATITMMENEMESFALFGHFFTLGKRKLTIIQPTIANIDEVKEQLKSGNQPILKIKSAVGRIVLEYVK